MISNQSVRQRIQKGIYKPHDYLTNMTIALWQSMPYVAKEIFPVVPVGTETGYYYEWKKEDMTRIQMADKPNFGKVSPIDMLLAEDNYSCKIKQVIVGLDDATNQNYTASGAAVDPRKTRSRLIAQQISLYMEKLIADNFFATGKWTEEWTGVAVVPGANQFYQFDDANSDPIGTFSAAKKEIMLAGLIEPNKLVLGHDVYETLKNHPDLVDRIKYNGNSGASPAKVNAQTLAELFEVEKVIVANSVYNAAAKGQAYNGNFIFNTKSALLCYAAPNPSIDEPSAGYTFGWDFDGNNWTVVAEFEGEGGTHCDYMEGLISIDPKITSQDLGLFMKECIS